MICVLANTPLGASTVTVSLVMPTSPGVTCRVRSLPVPVTLIPLTGATDSFEEATVTVSSLAGSRWVFDGDRHRFVGRVVERRRQERFRPPTIVGDGGGVPPEPIMVPGAKATPRQASLVGALAISSGTPLSVPLTPLTSEIRYRVPFSLLGPLLVA